MVVPAELLQVSYAAQLRLFLSKIFHSMTILTFKKLIFPAIQQEVILLLAERSSVKNHGINVIELEDGASLERLHLLSGEVGIQTLKPIEPKQDKWTQYFLSRDEILLLREIRGHDGLTRFGDIASVDVGIVTGKNRFFVVDIDTVRKFKLNDYVIPLVGRTAFLKGVIFMDKDWREIEVWLFILSKGLRFNEAYEKGFPRVGCMFCPYSSQYNEYLVKKYYSSHYQQWEGFLIRYARAVGKDDPEEYVSSGAWKRRVGTTEKQNVAAVRKVPCLKNTNAMHFVLDKKVNKEFIERFKPFGKIEAFSDELGKGFDKSGNFRRACCAGLA